MDIESSSEVSSASSHELATATATSNEVLEMKLETDPDPIHQVLGNRLLLKLLLEQLEEPSTELRKVRLISKDWKNLATTCLQKINWKNRNFVVLRGVDDLMKYATTLIPSLNNDFLYYGRKFLESNSDIPIEHEELLFQCYYVRIVRGCISQLNKEISCMFFQLFPQCIQSLKLKMHITLIDSETSESTFLHTILSSQSSSLRELKINAFGFNANRNISNQDVGNLKFPNLEYFAIKTRWEFWDSEKLAEMTRQRCDFLENFLKMIPEGKPVTICLLNWSNANETTNLLQKYNQINNLKILDINDVVKGEEFKTYGEAGVKLRTLAAMNYHRMKVRMIENIPTENVYNLICTQVDNLEELCWGSNWKFKFPAKQMVSLKKLKLASLIDRLDVRRYDEEPDEEEEEERPDDPKSVWNRSCRDRPIFYDSFPKLEELHLESRHERHFSVNAFRTWFLRPQLPCYSVKKLVINYSGLNGGILELICHTFPRLTSVKLGQTHLESAVEQENFFKALWGAEFGPNLEEFSITLGTFEEERDWRKYEVDSLFSGISEEIIQQITESSNYNTLTCPPDDSLSILSFKNLRKLEILQSWSFFECKGAFTDFSAYCVFGKMETLVSLCLPKNIWKDCFSKEAAAHLQRKFVCMTQMFDNRNQVPSADRLKYAFGTSFDRLAATHEVIFRT